MTVFEPDEGTEEPDAPAEGETPAGEPAPDAAEGEPEAPAPAELGEAEALALRTQRIDTQLTKLRAHVAKRMGEIFEEDAQLMLPCELCTPMGAPGWRPPIDLPDETRAALFMLLNQRAPVHLLEDPHSTPCDECGGEGQVDTRSRVPGQDALPCVKCKGLGWLATDGTRRGALGAALNGVEVPPFEGAPVLEADDAMSPEDLAEVARLRALGYSLVVLTLHWT